MKFWKTIIRIWFTMASLASFLVGWSVLAHAPKPNQFKASDVPELPKLEPVPTLNQLMFSERSFNFNQSNQRVRILRSGGS